MSQGNKPQSKKFIDLDFNTVWNSLLLVTVIGLLISTREDIASLGTIIHERESKIIQIQETLKEHTEDLNELKVRVGSIELELEKDD